MRGLRRYEEEWGWLGRPTHPQRRYVRRITLERPGDKPVILVSDLLDAVRIQTGRITLDFETLTVGAIVDQAEEMNRPLAAERNIHLETRAANRGLCLRVDRAREVLGYEPSHTWRDHIPADGS